VVSLDSAGSYRAPVERSRTVAELPWLRRVHFAISGDLSSRVTDPGHKQHARRMRLLRLNSVWQQMANICSALLPTCILSFSLEFDFSKFERRATFRRFPLGAGREPVPPPMFIAIVVRADVLVIRTWKFYSDPPRSPPHSGDPFCAPERETKWKRKGNVVASRENVSPFFKLIFRGCIQIFHPRHRHFSNWRRRDVGKPRSFVPLDARVARGRRLFLFNVR